MVDNITDALIDANTSISVVTIIAPSTKKPVYWSGCKWTLSFIDSLRFRNDDELKAGMEKLSSLGIRGTPVLVTLLVSRATEGGCEGDVCLTPIRFDVLEVDGE